MFSTSNKLIRVDFPEGLSRVYTAGDTVKGTVNLTLASAQSKMNGEQKALKMASVVAKLRVLQVSTYYRTRGASNNSREGRVETVRLYFDDKTLWEARAQPLPNPNLPPPTIQLPFHFILPPVELSLPPSFEGGTRGGSALGHQVGRIAYFIKITGKKAALLSIDERVVLPFIYMQPSLVHPFHLPPPLLPHFSTEKGVVSPNPPPPPTQQDGFRTTVAEAEFRQSMFGKKSRVVVKLSLPSIHALPRNHPVPYHLSILLLAPPGRPPPQLNLPSISSLELNLVRDVFAKAHGESQSFSQTVGPLLDLRTEPRTWNTPPEWKRDRGESRWGGEIVVAGELMIGGAAVPSFSVGSTRGLLACDYHVSLKLPLRGSRNDLKVDPFMPIVVTSNVHSGEKIQQGQQQNGTSTTNQESVDLPPSYLEIDLKFGEDVKEKRSQPSRQTEGIV